MKLSIQACLLLLASTFTSADIAFLSDRDGKGDVYVMNDDGSNVRRVTDTPFTQGNLNWAPDGRRITFATDIYSDVPGSGQQVEIFIISADGSGEQNLTEHPALDTHPSWAPDGKLLAFVSSRSENWEIHIMEVATRRVWQLTDTRGRGDLVSFASSPDWSPDGTQIAYTYSKEGQGRQIYIMDADGKNSRPLLKRPPRGIFGGTLLRFGPRWSPDGKHILYKQSEFAAGQGRVANSIVIVDMEAWRPKLTVLDTPARWLINGARWADDGNAVLFAAVPRGLNDGILKIFKIYKYRLSDGQITNLTEHPSANSSMAWTPHNSLAVSSAAKLVTQWARIKAASRDAPIPPTSAGLSN